MRASAAIAALAALAGSAPAPGEPPRRPTVAELRRIVLAEPAPRIDRARTAKLRAALEEHVAEFVRERRWAPFHEWRGLGASGVSMTEPADVLYALSLAYPHVSDELKPKVKAYLEREFDQHRPYARVDYADLGKGRPRNYHRVDPGDFAAACGRALVGDRRPKLYPLYVFADRTGNWKRLEAAYGEIRKAAESVPPRLVWFANPANRRNLREAAKLANNPRNVSSLIGFVRIAHRLGRTGDADKALEKLAGLVEHLLDVQRKIGADCEKYLDAGPRKDGHPSAGGQFRSAGGPYVGRTHAAAVVYSSDLCPEAGRIVRTYAPNAVQQVARWILRNAQGFFLVRGDTPVQEGEVCSPWYLTTMNYYHAICTAGSADFDTHRQLADRPACRADVYYVERLVRAIEASGP